jgi:phage gp46-like protein
MSDITTIWIVESGTGDWSLSGGALSSGDDLATAVLISLFTDRQADPADIPSDGGGDLRGWWGDQDEDVPIGSRLWLLDRSRLTPEVANTARIYMDEALKWVVDDEVAASVQVMTAIAGQSQLNSMVTITRSDGTVIPLKFNWAWR